MKLRFYNAKILTMENENIIEGELCTDGGKITYVGAERTSGGYDREIDLLSLIHISEPTRQYS